MPVPLDPLDADLDRSDAQELRNRLEPSLGRPGVEQCGEEHVAGDPADAVEVCNPAHTRDRAGASGHGPARKLTLAWTTAGGGSPHPGWGSE